MPLHCRLANVAELTPDERDALFALMDRHFEGMRRATFEADLDEKTWVLLLHEPASGALCGFSTQRLLHVTVAGRPIRALFSGDTIVAREQWGDPALSGAWGRLALRLIDADPEAELYWFLISKGYRTYRFLPLFFHAFYPRFDVATPGPMREVLDALARHKFGAAYDAVAGVVRTNGDKDRLRGDLADVPAERRYNPHVTFFLSRNPGYVRGEELCCLAPLTRANFTPAAYPVIGSAEPLP